jgi:hypothetical protein
MAMNQKAIMAAQARSVVEGSLKSARRGRYVARGLRFNIVEPGHKVMRPHAWELETQVITN